MVMNIFPDDIAEALFLRFPGFKRALEEHNELFLGTVSDTDLPCTLIEDFCKYIAGVMEGKHTGEDRELFLRSAFAFLDELSCSNPYGAEIAITCGYEELVEHNITLLNALKYFSKEAGERFMKWLELYNDSLVSLITPGTKQH